MTLIETSQARDPQKSPRRAIAVVLATLALTVCAYPAAVVDWIGETCDGAPACDGLLAAATAISDGLDQLGVTGLFDAGRERIRHDLRIDDG